MSNVIAVAGGSAHSLALRSDGTLAAWGDNSGGQCAIPAGLGGVVAIAVGGFHNLALKSDGTVAAWGAGNPSNPNNPTDLFDWGQSVVPAGVNGVVAVAAGSWHSLALVGGPRLAPPAPQPDGSMELILTGIPGWTYTVDVSSDLVNWTPLRSFVSTNSVTPFLDAAANNFSRRFYRAVAP